MRRTLSATGTERLPERNSCFARHKKSKEGLSGVLRIVEGRRSARLGLGPDQKAIEAAEKWKFAPGKKDGKPVAVEAAIEVNFRLL
jgi:Gram-negative bacterial TonB protein C-terminal